MIKKYLKMLKEVIEKLDREPVGQLLEALGVLKGRLFVLGVGGSAANASHAVNDFRKLCGIEAYSFDNLAELTARTNDDGWENCFKDWIIASRLNEKDMVLVFSVGGGKKGVSENIIEALKYAKKKKAKITGIVGRDGGYTKKVADICILIPTVSEYLITPYVEIMQSVLWHLLVFHPYLQIYQSKWESIALK